MRNWPIFSLILCAVLLTAGSVGSLATGPATQEVPLTVSPGSAEGIVSISERCPTFSWSQAPDAPGYELLVYRLGNRGEEAVPAFSQHIRGSALSWTPSLDRCLERGGRYAWTVRGAGSEKSSAWSPPSLFQVVAGPSAAEFKEALEVVRQYLATQSEAQVEEIVEAGSVGTAELSPEETPLVSDPSPDRAVGTTQLTIDGGVAATSFTGDGSTLTALAAANVSGTLTDDQIADDITLGDIKQILVRDIGSTTGDLDPDRLAGDTTDDDKVDSALVGAHGHDDLYYTETELSAPGAINTDSNPVDWTKIKGVPAGIADGTDTDTTCDGVACDGTSFSNVDAASLDGSDSTDFLRATASDTFETGTLATKTGTTLDVDGALDASGATSVALPATGISGGGHGSGLDADTVDGSHASAFMPAGTDTWVNTTGDTMTGTLTLDPVAGSALIAMADIELGGDILQSGSILLHHDGTDGNVTLGNSALGSTSSGVFNTALGSGGALGNNTTGSSNTAVGFSSLFGNSTGGANTAVGNTALFDNDSGGSNTAIGVAALRSNTSGGSNTAAGNSALRGNETGTGNTALGDRGLYSSTSGNWNTAIGKNALRNFSGGTRNVAMGYRAGYATTGGADNIFILNDGLAGDSGKIRIGTEAAQSATYIAGIHGTSVTGSSVVVTASGQLGIASGATGDAETLDGIDSDQFLRSDDSDHFSYGTLTTDAGTTLDIDGALDASGSASVALPTAGISGAGSGSGLDADTLDGSHAAAFAASAHGHPVETHARGTRNTAIGASALSSLTSATDNTAVGDESLTTVTNQWGNTAIGSRALKSLTTGDRNTAMGYAALKGTTTGYHNVAIGLNVMPNNLGGRQNTAAGGYALFTNTSGNYNTALGFNAGRNHTTGSSNTAVGGSALNKNQTSSSNTAVGVSACMETTGAGNTCVGRGALHLNTASQFNTAVGMDSLKNTSGTRNIGLGKDAGKYSTSGNDNIHIGSPGVAAETATIKIGTQGVQTATFVAGIHGASLSGSPVVVSSSGKLGVASGATGDADLLDGLDSTAFLQKTELDTEAELEAALGDVTNVLTDAEMAAVACPVIPGGIPAGYADTPPCTVTCPAAAPKVLGGGCSLTPSLANDIVVNNGAPGPGPSDWSCTARDVSGLFGGPHIAPDVLVASVFCAK